MGFLDYLGSVLGSLAGNMAEQAKLMNEFKSEYENMNNYDLKDEYRRWQSKSDREASLRKAVIKTILKERGEID